MARHENEQDRIRHRTSELLALIHGDGGHHENAVGTARALEDAIKVVNAIRQRAAERNYELLTDEDHPIKYPDYSTEDML